MIQNKRKIFSAEEIIDIVLEGLRGKCTIEELCSRIDLHPEMYYKWSNEFVEAGKQHFRNNLKMQSSNLNESFQEQQCKQIQELIDELSQLNKLLKNNLSIKGLFNDD